jgi:hypothetical protein
VPAVIVWGLGLLLEDVSGIGSIDPDEYLFMGIVKNIRNGRI